MKKIRIAYLISRYPAISHTFILREINGLRQLGFEIKVASINTTDRPFAQLTILEQEEAAATFYVKPAGLMGAVKAHLLTLFTQPLSYGRGLWFALRLGQTDLKKILYNFFYFVEAVMIGHWMRSQQLTHLHIHIAMAAATVGLIIKHTFPIHFSMTVHGPDEFYDTSNYYLRQKIVEAHFICCISHFAHSQLMMLSSPSVWEKLEISPLGVDPHLFAPCTFRETPTPFEILCVGRLVPVKGQLILLEAVAQLIAQGRVIHLRYIGDGPDRPHLQQRIVQQQLTQHIVLEGAVNQDKIRDFYAQADVFVLASFAERLPVVLMEAMMMQIPCITTHITGIPELIRNGEGLLVAPSDVAGLAQAIALLMDHPELRRQMGEAGRLSALQRYDLQSNTERLAHIFQRRLDHS
ncbi:MAG: colanic acid biosynthesis glycosyltransferase WcaL [Beggiatoa sp. IS2]|nr:MAG: colanic acid biosynthesis glycosyltransferase WcaL [Beggiatoa sp. IS2]